MRCGVSNIILRGTSRNSRLHFPNYIALIDDTVGATHKQCDRRADCTIRVGKSIVLIFGFGECLVSIGGRYNL